MPSDSANLINQTEESNAAMFHPSSGNPQEMSGDRVGEETPRSIIMHREPDIIIDNLSDGSASNVAINFQARPCKLKKDALYKPLIRKFRTFFRKLMDSLGLTQGCHHWSKDRYRRQIKQFMHFLELPPFLNDEKSFSGMAVLLFPTIHKRKQNSK